MQAGSDMKLKNAYSSIFISLLTDPTVTYHRQFTTVNRFCYPENF